MQMQGFDYIAYIPSQTSSALAKLTVEEFRKTYGYGISTIAPTSPTSSSDPNLAIVEKLSPEERQAYDEALIGAPSRMEEVRDESGNLHSTFDPESCVMKAYQTVLGVSALELIQNQVRLEEPAGELEDRIRADPRAVELWLAWADCMAAEGYDFANRDQLVTALMREAEEASDRPLISTDLPTSDTPSASDTLPEPIDSRAAQREVEIARADLACDDKVGLARVLYQIREAHQREFRAEYADVLAPYFVKDE